MDLEPLEEGVKQAALFEEETIFKGREDVGVVGLSDAAPLNLDLPGEATSFPPLVADAVARFQNNSIEGPYDLVVDTDTWSSLHEVQRGTSLRKRTENLLGGSIFTIQKLMEAISCPHEVETLD